MFYFTKTYVHSPYIKKDIAVDYCLHNEEGVLLGFVRQLFTNSGDWLLVDEGLEKAPDRVVARMPAGANASDLTQRLYMTAVLGMFSYQQGRADHPKFKNP